MVIIGLSIFTVCLILVLTDTAYIIDDPVRTFFYGCRNDTLDTVVSYFSQSCDWIYVAVFCLLFLVIPWSRFRIGVPLCAGMALVSGVNYVLKHIVCRPRPSDIDWLVAEDGFSFPSGHSITTMFVFGFLLYCVMAMDRGVPKTVLTVLVLVFMFGIGLSRIYVGVHYPTDVLAGWSLGMAAIGTILYADKLMVKNKPLSGGGKTW